MNGWEVAAEFLKSIGLGVGVPLILGWIAKHVRDQTMRTAIDMAVRRAGGIAYDYMAARGAGATASMARGQAINAGADYVASTMRETMGSLGLTEGVVKNMVTGELGKLLAVDPAVTVVTPGPVAAPAPTVVPAREA